MPQSKYKAGLGVIFWGKKSLTLYTVFFLALFYVLFLVMQLYSYVHNRKRAFFILHGQDNSMVMILWLGYTMITIIQLHIIFHLLLILRQLY